MFGEASHVGTFRCYYCNETMGVLLDRYLRDTLPMDCGVVGYDPCTKCADYMKEGIILISVRDGEMEKQEAERERALAERVRDAAGRSDRWLKDHPFRWMANPYRTGGWIVVTEDFIRRVLVGKILRQVLECRWAFVPDEVWDKMKLPRWGEEE